MYPTLTDLLYDLLGIRIPLPIQTFGFFMALGFLVAAILITRLFKDLEREGKIRGIKEKRTIGEPPQLTGVLGNAITGFLVGYLVVPMVLNWSSFAAQPQQFLYDLFQGAGNLIAGIIGAVFFAGLYYYNTKKEQLPEPQVVEDTIYPHQRVGDIIVIGAVAGILGAKIFTWIEDIDAFLADPVGALVSFSGLTFYGGLIVAAAGIIYYAYRKKIPIGRLLDVTAPALIIAYGVGRLGCHFAGDGDWGIPNPAAKPFPMPDWLWSYRYPNNVINEGIPIEGCTGSHCMILPEGVYPTSVYEFLMTVVILLILLLLRKRFRVPAMVFGVYLVLNGLERFLIETIRVNDRYNFLGMQLSQAQIIAIFLMLLGAALLVLLPRFVKVPVVQPIETNNRRPTT